MHRIVGFMVCKGIVIAKPRERIEIENDHGQSREIERIGPEIPGKEGTGRRREGEVRGKEEGIDTGRRIADVIGTERIGTGKRTGKRVVVLLLLKVNQSTGRTGSVKVKTGRGGESGLDVAGQGRGRGVGEDKVDSKALALLKMKCHSKEAPWISWFIVP